MKWGSRKLAPVYRSTGFGTCSTRPAARADLAREFRRIPQHFRANVDSKQVGKYLDRVLAIIGEYDER